MSSKVHLLTKQFEFELKANLGIDYSTGKAFSPGAYIVVRVRSRDMTARMVFDGSSFDEISCRFCNQHPNCVHVRLFGPNIVLLVG